MFTVVIAEKEHLNKIEQYRFFLDPFFDNKRVAFCEWKPYEEQLIDAVPGLFKAISGHQEWRLLIVADEMDMDQQNPFDRVRFVCPKREEGESEEQYDQRIHLEKLSAYERALDNPIIRVVTHMSEWPQEVGGINNLEVDSDYAYYLEESRKKMEIRKRILPDRKEGFILPAQILCIARRNYRKDENYLNTVWVPHYEEQYSEFAERNLYFDKMRFLIFDIKDKNHEDYGYDYLRFLYTLVIVADNEPPRDSLKAKKVYNLKSSLNREKLYAFIDNYDKKLLATEKQIYMAIREIEETPKVYLTDEQAEAITATKIEIPMKASQEVHKEEVYIKPAIGLSTDCPADENNAWAEGRIRSEAGMKRLMKRTRRVFQRAAGSFRESNKIDDSNSAMMKEHQVEDMKENADSYELKMASIDLPNMFDGNMYQERLNDADVQVKNVIKTRMSKKTTVVFGVIVLIAVLLGFVPLIIRSVMDIQLDKFIILLIYTGAALAAFVLLAIIILVVLRKKLTGKINDYNAEVDGAFADIDSTLSRYGEYIGYACNVMRANSVINDYYENNDPEKRQIRIFRRHIVDIRDMREIIYDAFGDIMNPNRVMRLDGVEPYDYDFRKSMDYQYPVDFNPYDNRNIDFMQIGNKITLPVSFIESIAIEREELYD